MSLKHSKKLLVILFLGVHVSGSLQAVSLVECMSMAYAYLKDPYSVGELVPLSNVAGRYLTKFVTKRDAGQCYLEVGAGHGAITTHIIEKLHSTDMLDVIEIDPVMCQTLKERFASYSNVTIHCCSILDWHPEYKYDAIISTLPFNSFGVDFAKEVMDLYKSLANHACMVSYVEYDIVDRVVKYFYTSEGRYVHNQVQQYLKDLRKDYLLEEKIIYKNFPALKIYHLKF